MNDKQKNNIIKITIIFKINSINSYQVVSIYLNYISILN